MLFNRLNLTEAEKAELQARNQARIENFATAVQEEHFAPRDLRVLRKATQKDKQNTPQEVEQNAAQKDAFPLLSQALVDEELTPSQYKQLIQYLGKYREFSKYEKELQSIIKSCKFEDLILFFQDGVTKELIQIMKAGQTCELIKVMKAGQTCELIKVMKAGQTGEIIEIMEAGQTGEIIEIMEAGQTGNLINIMKAGQTGNLIDIMKAGQTGNLIDIMKAGQTGNLIDIMKVGQTWNLIKIMKAGQTWNLIRVMKAGQTGNLIALLKRENFQEEKEKYGNEYEFRKKLLTTMKLPKKRWRNQLLS